MPALAPRHLPAALAALVAAAGLATACADSDPPAVACTLEFRVITLAVQDAAGTPVTDALVRVFDTRAGRELPPPAALPPFSGTYPVVDDGYLAQLTRSGHPFRVTAARGTLSGTAELVIGTDAGPCHVEKKAGPDTLVLR